MKTTTLCHNYRYSALVCSHELTMKTLKVTAQVDISDNRHINNKKPPSLHVSADVAILKIKCHNKCNKNLFDT